MSVKSDSGKGETFFTPIICQRVPMEGPMAPAAYIAEDGFVGHQTEERPLVL